MAPLERPHELAALLDRWVRSQGLVLTQIGDADTNWPSFPTDWTTVSSIHLWAYRLTMSEAQALFAVLRQSADADCVAAIERLVREAPDRKLSRINVLDFARREGLDEEQTIAAFLHAARIGLFDLSWNVLCPSCGGVLDANATLKSVRCRRILLCVLQPRQRARRSTTWSR